MRARSKESRSRARRTAAVAAAVVALVAAACNSAASAPPTTTARTSSPLPVVVTSERPGWVPVPYGNVQIEVPRSWSISKDGGYACGPAHGSVYLGKTSTVAGQKACPAENEVWFEDLAKTELLPLTRTQTVNGITVEAAAANEPDDATFFVPAKGFELGAQGPQALRVLETLTNSPLAVVTASASPTRAPASWSSVSFGGVTFQVPRSWTTQRTRNVGFCWLAVDADVLWLSSAQTRISPSCPAPGSRASDLAAQQGLDLFSGRYSGDATPDPTLARGP